ncbi:hypothetical protein LAZ67_19001715 [Cordylochernes scorpioides]|uniref:Reverse transcriptase domain-containing protein n=1 Tax=Cordylochernes scorpioides TaxID=51811 RepID=A0ABY6LHZ4_9ARAC|nr:hypothetical protein LAZ67_19001715 [Cordylochernes scorpioides]
MESSLQWEAQRKDHMTLYMPTREPKRDVSRHRGSLPTSAGHEPRQDPAECTNARPPGTSRRPSEPGRQQGRDQCVYLEFCPDFTQEQYFWALEAKLGKGTVYQLTKMEGQILVGLSNVQQADKLVEDGLEIEDAILRATPLKKRAERIVFGNVPFFIENGDLVAALRPYGQITSIAFITLRDGVKLSHIPARLEIKSKGVTSHVYVTYGIRCSLCHKQGHKRSNCPRKTGVQEASLLLPGDSSPGPKNAGRRQPPSSNTMPALSPTKAAGPPSIAAPTPAASSAPPAAPPPAAQTQTTAAVDPSPPPPRLSSGVKESKTSSRNMPNMALENPKASTSPDEMKKEEIQVSSPSGTPSKTRKQLNDLLERVPNDILDQPEFEGLERSDILEAQATVPGLKKLQKKIGPAQLPLRHLQASHGRSCPDEKRPMSFRLASINARGLAAHERSIELCHFLRQHRVDVAFIQETNVSSLDAIQHLCLGYSATIVPPAALRCSGLACLFAPGVAVLRQRVMWPGNISIVSIDVRGQEVRQLEFIKAAAIQEDAWVVGDLNIDDQSTSDTASSSVEALTELMEQTALVDVATLFNAAHLPTRVASCRRRVDTARLHRIILPSRLLERMTLYKTIYYRLSDHRAVLVQLGSPPFLCQPCVAAMLRSVLVDEYLLATIERTAESNADIVAEDDQISRAGRFMQARLQSASSAADYPSLPDLVRSLRVRRPACTNIRDEDGSIIEGEELRRRAYSIYQRRFAREPSDPIAAAEFIRGTTTPLTLEEDDPLIRPVITGAEIAAAIRRLPLGRAPGLVFEASKLRGALPSLIRRSTNCLVPKSNGGPGVSAYRPISLPTADYRVLGNILLQRLRPHLPVLVPWYQTYAVPGRSLSWNVARIADEIHMATRNGSLMASLRLPPAFIEWFLLLYAGADAAVRAGGLHTRPFHLLNGVKQGCAVSAALFSLATGPLLVRLERALGPGSVLAYADDIVLLIRRDEVFDVVRNIFEDFRHASGIDEQHLLALLEGAITRWVPFTRGLSLVGRARATNLLVLSAVVHHLHGYLPTDSTIAKLQSRLVHFVWGSRHTTWLPGGVLARPVSVGGLGLLDIGTQPQRLLLARCEWDVAVSSDIWDWLPPRRRRLLRLWEAVLEILELNHRVLPPHQLQELHVIGDCWFLRPPDLLVASRWAGLRVGDITSSSSLPLRTTRATLDDIAALTTFCSLLVEQNRNHTHRVDNIDNAILLRGTATPLQRLTTRTTRCMLERPRLAALPITQLLGRWLPHGHNADVAVRLALHALPHPAHPASARESCIACGSGDLLLAHRYWSCRRIRPVIVEAFTIIQRPPDLQSWIFGHDLEENALAIMASAKTRIYKYFLALDLRGVQEDPLLFRPADKEEVRAQLYRKLTPGKGYLQGERLTTRLEALYLELVVLNERCQAILLAKAEATDDEIDREFEDCEPYITERYYLKARIRVMREQDRDAQAKTSQVPPGASSASPNSDADNQKVIKLQNTSASLSKSPEKSVKNEIEGVEKEDSVKTARATDVKPTLAEARILKEACSAPSIIDIEYEGRRGAVNAIKEKDSEAELIEGVKESEAKPKGEGVKESEAKPKGDGVNDSEAKPKGDGVKDSGAAIKGYDPVSNPRAVAEGTDSKVEEEKLDVEQGTDSRVEENLDAEQGTDSKVEEKLDVEQGTESRVEENLDVEQGTDSRVEENLDAEQGTESRMEEGIIDPKDWFKSESRATPIRPVFGDASCRGHGALALRRLDVLACRLITWQHAVDVAFTRDSNVTTLDSFEDLCLEYKAEIVPVSGARRSGLACIFSSGVQVIRQRVLSPGKIPSVDVTIRRIKATFINSHFSHAPDEQLQQLQAIAAAAESASDIASGSVEALGELLNWANLVDAAAIFDATHLPTRISSCGSLVDASRLDRVLLLTRLSNLITRYWSLYYKNSDHRAVLLQIGEAPEPRPPCIASMLRSRLVVRTVETLLSKAFGNIKDMQNAEIWRRWGQIKAHLASAIKSLHDLCNHDDDYISRARKYVRIKLEDVSINWDYPSLPDLGRDLSLRSRGTSSTTFYDSAGRVITGTAMRDLAFANLKERFSHPTCSPEDIDGFLRRFTLRVTIEKSDALHPYGIGEEEIVNAIGRLPTGKAAGWDDLPCEIFRGFEDFFANALRRVFEASYLCGALSSSMRGSEMSLIAKPHGVLSGVLYWRLRPHLRDIVPECQSYAVPAKTPAWIISRVADEVATACREKTPLAVVATDLESSFDTLVRGFLMSVLLSFGLHQSSWGIEKTPLFYILNGVRQGCAASAAFFTISTGPLLLRLEQLLGQNNVLAYADDIVLLIREDGQLEELLEKAIAKWSPFVRGLSLAGRAKAANSLVLSAIYYHLQAYLSSETTIARLQARLVRFVWGHDRISLLPSCILARPIFVGGMGLLDVGTQLCLSCLKGVQAALRGGRNAHSCLAESGMWLSPAFTPGTWLPPLRRRSLHLFEAAAEILELNHRILQPALLRDLRVMGDCRFLRPPELLAPTRWLGWRIGELTGSPPNIFGYISQPLRPCGLNRGARNDHRLPAPKNPHCPPHAEVFTPGCTAHHPAAGTVVPHVSIPIFISLSSLRRCAFSGHNADVAVRLALHAFPHPAHPASARESCIACGSGDLSLAHRYWSFRQIRPVIVEAFPIIQQPPDLQSWISGHDLEDDALAIMASAKTRIYKHFLGALPPWIPARKPTSPLNPRLTSQLLLKKTWSSPVTTKSCNLYLATLHLYLVRFIEQRKEIIKCLVRDVKNLAGTKTFGDQLRRSLLERLSSRFAQAPSSKEAIADFLAEVTPQEFDQWDQLFLAEICHDQIAAAIHRPPNGRARVFEASRLRGDLPPYSRRSKIILLPKVHGGPGLQAFRPISLPTTDYTQTYAVPGQSSSCNIVRVSEEAAGTSRHNTSLAIISLDLNSAFDTLSRSYLFALLEKLGLPSTFLGWIAVLYGEADASIRVGYVYTKAFPLLNGVRQACRLSAALFSIGVGPLLRRLERILSRGSVVAYADDIVLFIRGDAQFEHVPLIFEEFRMPSGVAVNFKKSCGLWCDSWKHRTDSPLGISWTSESLTVLGCTITTRNTVASQASHLMGLLERAIARWSPFTRGLLLVGRARAAKSLILGSILHHLHGYISPETYVGRLQARLARFVWCASRVSWLPGHILARPVSDGDVGLLYIAGQLRLSCLKGFKASLRGPANGYFWRVVSRAWLTPPASDVWLSPRRRRLLSLWESASSVLELDHRSIHPASLRSLRLRGDNRFLRPPDLLAPERWLQATVEDYSDGAPALARSTRAALQHLRAFCQQILRENASSSYHAEYEAETIACGDRRPHHPPNQPEAGCLVNPHRGCAPLHPLGRPASKLPPGHDADVALRLALHALPHPDHPASRRANFAACGSSDGSLAHRYWSCRNLRPLLREVFAEAIAARPSLQPRRERKYAVTHLGNSRQQQELAKARSAAATFDQCFFIEWSPDIYPFQYMKALEQLLEKSSVYQLMKMSGHVLVGLSSTEKVERLNEEGLTIGSTLLRAFPYRKKAEKIIIGNLPIAVKDENIVAALRPYCKVASMAYEIVTCEDYSWTTGSREAFVLLNEGR